jgi:hypothetical protein
VLGLVHYGFVRVARMGACFQLSSLLNFIVFLPFGRCRWAADSPLGFRFRVSSKKNVVLQRIESVYKSL